MAEDYFDKPAISKPVVGAVIAVLVLVIGGGYYWYTRSATEAPAPVIPPPVPEAPEEAPRIEHPVPSADASKAALPELNDSDKAVAAALDEAAGNAAVSAFLVPDSIVRHIVVTVDNLPRQKVAVDKRPVVPAPGLFTAQGDELHATLDSRNFQRYAPIVDVLRKTDMQRLGSVYLRFYPLFQKAYQDLGYPNGYFNDRLVKVIDELLATPQVAGSVDLVRPNVMYVFADQSLESRSAGQKLLIRMGPDNAAVVKSKLTELRAIITAAAPRH
jgi:hypothetical protein